MKFLQIKLEDNLHYQFKKRCFEENTTMSDNIKKYILNLLTNDNNDDIMKT